MDDQELFDWLKTSEEARKLCGIKANGDGTYWIEDLELIKSQPEETKQKLRTFLKHYGRKPEVQSEPVTKESVSSHQPSSEVRAQLDALYKHIDELKAKVPPGKKYL